MSGVKTPPTRPLGKNGPLVPRLGLGLMGASGQYGTTYSEEERLSFLDQAYEMREWFWDTGKRQQRYPKKRPANDEIKPTNTATRKMCLGNGLP